jgi:hypothetical protein
LRQAEDSVFGKTYWTVIFSEESKLSDIEISIKRSSALTLRHPDILPPILPYLKIDDYWIELSKDSSKPTPSIQMYYLWFGQSRSGIRLECGEAYLHSEMSRGIPKQKSAQEKRRG